MFSFRATERETGEIVRVYLLEEMARIYVGGYRRTEKGAALRVRMSAQQLRKLPAQAMVAAILFQSFCCEADHFRLSHKDSFGAEYL